MKKIGFLPVLALFVFVSCTPKGVIKDGYYLALGNKVGDTQWTEFVTVEVKDGLIQEVKWDGFNYDYNGTLRDAVSHEALSGTAIDASYLERVDNFSELVKENFIGNLQFLQTQEEFPEGFISLVQKALKNGAVKPGLYRDGDYTLASDPDDKGFYSVLTLIIRGGNIIAGSWNQINTEGSSKRDLARNGLYNMGGAYTWDEQADLCIQKLVKLQRPERIFLNDDGKTDVISGVTIFVTPFIMIAEQVLSSATNADGN